MVLYGLRGFTHGWGIVLTVMSPEGVSAILIEIEPGEDIAVQGGVRSLVQYHEKRRGALDRLIERYGIVVLPKADWDRKKAEFGDRILR